MFMITWNKEDLDNQKGTYVHVSTLILTVTDSNRSTSSYNSAIKQKIISEIQSTPNCTYTEDEVKGKLI